MVGVHKDKQKCFDGMQGWRLCAPLFRALRALYLVGQRKTRNCRTGCAKGRSTHIPTRFRAFAGQLLEENVVAVPSDLEEWSNKHSKIDPFGGQQGASEIDITVRGMSPNLSRQFALSKILHDFE
jgi:hypothetical protein